MKSQDGPLSDTIRLNFTDACGEQYRVEGFSAEGQPRVAVAHGPEIEDVREFPTGQVAKAAVMLLLACAQAWVAAARDRSTG